MHAPEACSIVCTCPCPTCESSPAHPTSGAHHGLPTADIAAAILEAGAQRRAILTAAAHAGIEIVELGAERDPIDDQLAAELVAGSRSFATPTPRARYVELLETRRAERSADDEAALDRYLGGDR